MYNDVWNALEQATLFAGMKAEEIEGELKALDFNVRDIPAKDTFLYQGKACQEAIIVLDGELVARMTEGDNKPLTVDYLRTGTLLTPAFLFSNDRNAPVSLMAVSQARLFCMSVAHLDLLLHANMQVRHNFLRLLSDINLFLLNKIKSVYLAPLRERLAQHLLRMARKTGSSNITLHHSRQELADLFGVKKSSLIRSLSELEAQGAIFVRQKEIVILNVNMLKAGA